jgi:hypothetical protein
LLWQSALHPNPVTPIPHQYVYIQPDTQSIVQAFTCHDRPLPPLQTSPHPFTPGSHHWTPRSSLLAAPPRFALAVPETAFLSTFSHFCLLEIQGQAALVLAMVVRVLVLVLALAVEEGQLFVCP